jgi:hypothetical protein
MAGAGLCREAGALAHKLLIAWDPPAELLLRIPSTRKTRFSAKRRRVEHDAGKGGGGLACEGHHGCREAGACPSIDT